MYVRYPVLHCWILCIVIVLVIDAHAVSLDVLVRSALDDVYLPLYDYRPLLRTAKALLNSSHLYLDVLHKYSEHGIVVDNVKLYLSQMQQSKTATVE